MKKFPNDQYPEPDSAGGCGDEGKSVEDERWGFGAAAAADDDDDGDGDDDE